MVFCSAYGCSNSSAKGKNPGVTFHKFPLDPERRALWVHAVRRKDWSPSHTARLCSDHFKEEDFDRTSRERVRLREETVPSVFPGFPSHMQTPEVVSLCHWS
ncbi:hypothetical protein M8J75_005585 [Diaphorina citri]|nr:hypothetical protein M8J75_005585 [Diaphorina citri]